MAGKMSWPKWLKIASASVQYFYMAITKLGAQILGGIEKTGLFGLSVPANLSSGWKRIGETGSMIGSFAMPAMMAAGTANNIASGEQSLGEGLGDLAGGLAGWSLGSKAFNALAQKVKPIPAGGKAGLLRSLLGGAAGFAGSMLGGEMGSSIGHIVLPWQRKPKNVQDYWQTGWSGRPDA